MSEESKVTFAKALKIYEAVKRAQDAIYHVESVLEVAGWENDYPLHLEELAGMARVTSTTLWHMSDRIRHMVVGPPGQADGDSNSCREQEEDKNV